MSVEKKIPSSDEYDQPEYGFDTFSGQLLVGKGAIDAHVESGGNPDDIKDVRELLISNNKDFTGGELPSSPKEFNRDIAIQDGRFVINLARSYTKDAQLTLPLLEQARRLGLLTYPTKRIRAEGNFNSSTSYFMAVGESSKRRRQYFDNMGILDLVEHFKKIGGEEGQRPTQFIITRRIKEGRLEPSPTQIRRLIKQHDGRLTLHDICAMAGYPEYVGFWEDQEFKEWGVRAKLANGGVRLTEAIIDYLSSVHLGPSTFPIRRRFGGVERFNAEVNKQYEIAINVDRGNRCRLLEEAYRIQQANGHGILANLLTEGLDENEMVKRYAKFLVMRDLLGNSNDEAQYTIASGNSKTARKRGFIAAIRQVNGAISGGDIETSAMSLGVFDILWPPDYSYLTIPTEIIGKTILRS